MRTTAYRTSRIAHTLAAAIFTVAALWSSRAVLEHPATVVNYDPTTEYPRQWERGVEDLGELLSSDLKRGVAQLAYAARMLSTNPRHFFDGWMCYPIDGVALGEHMLGDGILGIPAQVLWDDPVVTYNFVVTLKPWIAAVGMYALAYHWTGSWAAALLAGFLFGFHPMRLSDLAHPTVVGNEWIPAILLFLDRLFAAHRWRDALALAAVACLQLLSSMYVLIQCLLVVGVYGLYLLWRHRAAVPALLPKLALVAAGLAATAIWALVPYLQAQEIWGLQPREGGFRGPPRFFLYGGRYYPGTGLLLLALLGLAERLLRRREVGRYDPRLPMTAATLASLWFLFPWRVPFTEHVVPTLGELLRSYLPGAAAVRAPDKVFFGVVVPLAALAAYGLRAIAWRLGATPRAVVLALVAAACAAEVLVPSLAQRSFRAAAPTSAAFRLKPPEADVEAVRDLPPDPVLDLPGNYSFFWVGKLSRYVLLGAYHERRMSTCKASFPTPVKFEVNAISRRLPSPDAAKELWALGFRTVIFHAQDMAKVRDETDRLLEALVEPTAEAHLVPIREGATIRVARLMAAGPVSTDLDSLAPAPQPRLPRSLGDVGLPFGLKSVAATFRHPDPIEPTDLLVTWRERNTVVHLEELRELLPLALAAGRSTDISVAATMPEAPGRYDVTLALADDPNVVLGRERIVVRAAARGIPAK